MISFVVVVGFCAAVFDVKVQSDQCRIVVDWGAGWRASRLTELVCSSTAAFILGTYSVDDDDDPAGLAHRGTPRATTPSAAKKVVCQPACRRRVYSDQRAFNANTCRRQKQCRHWLMMMFGQRSFVVAFSRADRRCDLHIAASAAGCRPTCLVHQ